MLGPTLHKLQPFASALGPANEATRKLALKTTPIFKNEIRPFAREILPVVNELGPSTQQLGEAFPKLAVSFKVLNEFFNELAYNPGPNKAGFLFFLDWGNHNLNSVVSSSDAHGPLGRSLVYFNCEVLPILNGVARSQRNRQAAGWAAAAAGRRRMREQGLEGAAATRPAHTAASRARRRAFTGRSGQRSRRARRRRTAKSAAHGSAAAAARAGAASRAQRRAPGRGRLRCRSAPPPSATSS